MNDTPAAGKVRLVADNLNIHGVASRYETLPPTEARRLAEKLEIHYAPKHGSCPNIAEIEPGALGRRCPEAASPTSPPCGARRPHGDGAPVNRRLAPEDARIKLIRLYPKLWLLRDT